MNPPPLRCIACGDPTEVGHVGAAGYAIFCRVCYRAFEVHDDRTRRPA